MPVEIFFTMWNKRILLNFVIISVKVYLVSSDQQCQNQFPNCTMDGITYVNSACKWNSCKPRSSGCLEFPSDVKFRQTMLDIHNELRNKIASGSDRRGGITNVANMMALSYDVGLEHTAKCHIHGCQFKHDKCRGTKRFPNPGQNIALKSIIKERLTESDYKNFSRIETFIKFVGMWYDEIERGSFKDNIDPFISTSKAGHFTQLIWAKTTHIGCARATDRSVPNTITILLFCNYAPPGNVIGGSMYISGSSCTQCPQNVKCNTKYKSLCGQDYPAPNETIGGNQNIIMSNVHLLGISFISLYLFEKIIY